MRMLDIGKTKLYELIGTGELETIHIGRRTLVLQASIDAMIQRLRQAPGENPHSIAASRAHTGKAIGTDILTLQRRK